MYYVLILINGDIYIELTDNIFYFQIISWNKKLFPKHEKHGLLCTSFISKCCRLNTRILNTSTVNIVHCTYIGSSRTLLFPSVSFFFFFFFFVSDKHEEKTKEKKEGKIWNGEDERGERRKDVIWTRWKRKQNEKYHTKRRKYSYIYVPFVLQNDKFYKIKLKASLKLTSFRPCHSDTFFPKTNIQKQREQYFST